MHSRNDKNVVLDVEVLAPVAMAGHTRIYLAFLEFGRRTIVRVSSLRFFFLFVSGKLYKWNHVGRLDGVGSAELDSDTPEAKRD